MPSFRRYSEPCLTDLADEVDCRRIPPLPDMVVSNNDRNDKLSVGDVDCMNEFPESSLDPDEFDDDWFTKFPKGSEGSNRLEPAVDGVISEGFSSSEIPLIYEDDLDFRERTMRTLRRGMKKIWRRGSATITQADPTNKVVYLGNVLTGWAKGEGCMEKPLHTLWKNYSSSTKPDVHMKLTVTQSGLKAVTKDHGLTEYWSHRITYCCAPPNLPRVFCWVYRHEGRKLKQELRCHAVFCSKESTARRMASTLRQRLTQALSEFKRDKLLKQNARLSLANSVYDNPSLPRRKILLSIGSQNYRPPLERSKSAPKLMSIEESLEEEESSPESRLEVDKVKEPQSMPVCKVEEGKERDTSDDKSDFKIANLNFVKKLCSSIENLVENTSNYGRKLLNECRPGKDYHIGVKQPEDPNSKKPSEDEDAAEKMPKNQKSVTFEEDDADREGANETGCDERAGDEMCPGRVAVEVKDHESDEGSNSLQSLSSWSSDVSSMVTTSSDKSGDAKTEETVSNDYLEDVHIPVYKGSIDRLHTYLKSCSDSYFDEGKVVLHPTGEVEERGTEDGRGETYSITRIDSEEVDSLSEDDGIHQEEDVVSDESGYVELSDHIVKRLSLDRKEKDIPYHQIIKSSLLTPRGFESSCLQV